MYITGTNRDVSQLQWTPWRPYPMDNVLLPMYWTHSLDERNDDIEYAIIVQHGESTSR